MASTPAAEIGDEADSCFEFIKQRNLAKVGALRELGKQQSTKPAVVSVSPIKVSPVGSVKPAGLSSSPLKHKIDRIAENLKAKQEMRQTAMPRVVHVKKEAKGLDEKLKSLKISTKELAHQLILLRCRKMSSSDLELSVNLTAETAQAR